MPVWCAASPRADCGRLLGAVARLPPWRRAKPAYALDARLCAAADVIAGSRHAKRFSVAHAIDDALPFQDLDLVGRKGQYPQQFVAFKLYAQCVYATERTGAL